MEQLQQAAIVLIYCTSGTGLTLMNKQLSMIVPSIPFAVIFQNVVTLAFLFCGYWLAKDLFGKLPTFDFSLFRAWIALALLFSLMLVSSLLALHHVTAPTLVVFRTLSTIVVALFDRIFKGVTISFPALNCLFGLQLGAALYSWHDVNFSAIGYFWLTVNVLSTSTYQVYVKTLVASFPNLGPFDMSLINNIFSIPFLALAAGFLDGAEPFSMGLWSSPPLWVLLGVSGLLGFVLSVTGFTLNRTLSATSLMVVNNVNKFAVILLSELLYGRTMDLPSLYGSCVVLGYGWLYYYARQWTASVGVACSLPLLIIPVLIFVPSLWRPSLQAAADVTLQNITQ